MQMAPPSLPNITNTIEEQDESQYLSPWDLKLQEKMFKMMTKQDNKHLTNSIPEVEQNEYSPPWEHNQTILLKSLSTPQYKQHISAPLATSSAISTLNNSANINNNQAIALLLNQFSRARLSTRSNSSSSSANSSTSSLSKNSPPSIPPPPLPPSLPPPSPPTSSLTSSLPSSSSLNRNSFNNTLSHFSMERQCWFHGRITRKQAEKILANRPVGSFLVRQSESGNSNDYSLSLVGSGCVHMRICMKNGEFILGQCSQPFNSIVKMIEHYAKVEVPIKGALHVRLTNPVPLSI